MWVKICGITCPEDASDAVQAGADAIGLNFFPGSRRFVSPDIAARIATVVRSESQSVELVGVFVDADPEHIRHTASLAGLTAVQLHGDESPAQAAAIHKACPDLKLIRALRISEQRMEASRRLIDETSAVAPLAAFLADAFVEGQFGGTGCTIEVPVRQLITCFTGYRTILAGGLTPDNVRTRLTNSGAWGADTAGGVEIRPGVKSAELVRRFVAAAKASARNNSSADGITAENPRPADRL